jgi:hypothetical protein
MVLSHWPLWGARDNYKNNYVRISPDPVLLVWPKYVLWKARTLYVPMHTVPIKFFDLPMIGCRLLHRAFRGLSIFESPADIQSTQALTAAGVNMSAGLFPDAELY